MFDLPWLSDVLNGREQAILVWSVVALVWVLTRRDIRRSLGTVVLAFFHPKLARMWIGTAAYLAVAVWLGHRIGVWHASSTKETIFWFVGTGLVLTGRATQAASKPDYF
jgi:hypothetical protein